MLDGGSYLSEIREEKPRTALLLEKIINGVNQLGISVGADPTGHTSPPDPPQSIQVSAGSDHVHVTLTDSAQRSRALNYFLEWSANDPAFMKPNVDPTPVTLTGASTLNLLTSTGAGTAPTSGEVGGQGFGTDQFA